MAHTIDLSREADRELKKRTKAAGESEDKLLQRIARPLIESYLHGGAVEPIRSTPGVIGGDACIRDTRIPVWLLVQYKRQGMSDGELLQSYPGLNASDLIAAWDYFAAHSEDVDRQMREHEKAA